MKLSKEQVKHVANLSQLKLSDAEVIKFGQQLSSILGYIELLNEVDTSNVLPTSQTTGLTNVTRKDSPPDHQCLTQEESLANALDKKNGYIKTEAVL